MALDVLNPLIRLAEKAADIYLLKEGRKYIEEIKNLRLKYEEESNKGYNADDALIVALLTKIRITAEALDADIDRTKSIKSP